MGTGGQAAHAEGLEDSWMKSQCGGSSYLLDVMSFRRQISGHVYVEVS